jgi:hypothetical protein
MTKEELEQFKARINFTLCAQGISIVVSGEKVLETIVALEQAWEERDALKEDADLCKKIIEEVVRRNSGSTPSWLIDMGPNVPKPLEPIDVLRSIEASLVDSSNLLQDERLEANERCERLEEAIDEALRLTQAWKEDDAGQSGDYDAP